jgi:hypothetical protein
LTGKITGNTRDNPLVDIGSRERSEICHVLGSSALVTRSDHEGRRERD